MAHFFMNSEIHLVKHCKTLNFKQYPSFEPGNNVVHLTEIQELSSVKLGHAHLN